MKVSDMLHDRIGRRNVMRGMLGGTAVTVGLPILECMLNANGTAYAATGQALAPCSAPGSGAWAWSPGGMGDPRKRARSMCSRITSRR